MFFFYFKERWHFFFFTLSQCLRSGILQQHCIRRGDRCLSATPRSLLVTATTMRITLWSRALGGLAISKLKPRQSLPRRALRSARNGTACHRCRCALSVLLVLFFPTKLQRHRPPQSALFLPLPSWRNRTVPRRSSHPSWRDWKIKTSWPAPHSHLRAPLVTALFVLPHLNGVQPFAFHSSCWNLYIWVWISPSGQFLP